MPTEVTIHVFRDGPELLPSMCMFCGDPLDEDDFQSFMMTIGPERRPIKLPICRRDRSLAGQQGNSVSAGNATSPSPTTTWSMKGNARKYSNPISPS